MREVKKWYTKWIIEFVLFMPQSVSHSFSPSVYYDQEEMQKRKGNEKHSLRYKGMRKQS